MQKSCLVTMIDLLHQVDVIPVFLVPAGYEPDIALGLSHVQFEGLAHDMSSCWLIEVRYDDLGSPHLDVHQVLRSKRMNSDA